MRTGRAVTLSPMSDRQTAPEIVEESRLTVALIAVASVAWTAAMLWSARASITSRADAAMEVTSTAYALPGAVSAVLVAGAAVALLVLTLVSGRRPLGPTVRFAVATGSGLLVGLAAAIPIFTINTLGTIYAAVGGTLAAAATIGGALAGLRIPRVVAAVAAASVGVFLIGFVLNLFQEPVLDAFGAGDTESSANAAQWFSYSQAALSGLAAGIISYLLLRRAGEGVRWPMYALAGAGPGLLLVIGELLSRTAGAEVLELAGKVSELEKTVQELLSTARLNNALIVVFAGALTAIVAVGRTLGPAADSAEPEAAKPQAAKPQAAKPQAAKPEAAKPEAAKPEAEEEPQSSSSSSETAYHSNS
ncbi:hypothetical protein Ait01nite_019490 [Actinoplanes italicus]|uniref:Uncharacterized protein n=2 Tax=Actinoplanes italicus TaxID=113567 RepID=A0A2T0KPI0_9ACTN|nr:hypothetical protein CLV67_101365 [Actinoplanes italicus]GIE28904.1 hypothetical protein Ait01nite_019490 [Actinoplanes italicus]